jgi:hypothetical protein
MSAIALGINRGYNVVKSRTISRSEKCNASNILEEERDSPDGLLSLCLMSVERTLKL